MSFTLTRCACNALRLHASLASSTLPVGIGASAHSRFGSLSSLCGVAGGNAMRVALRGASHIKIANRRKVEMFMGKRFHLPTRLKTAAPDVAAEWDYEKNPGHLYPALVGVGSMHVVWWKCGRCEHSYQMSVEKRVVRGKSCPLCSSVGRQETSGVQEGYDDTSLRAKRPPMFTIRTKY